MSQLSEKTGQQNQHNWGFMLTQNNNVFVVKQDVCCDDPMAQRLARQADS